MAIFLELLNLLCHASDFFNDIKPLNIFPFGKSVLYFGVEVVKLIEEFNLLFGFVKLWVLLVWKTKEFLSTVVREELSFSDKIFFLEHLKSVKSNLWFNTRNTWTIFDEVCSECGDIINEEVNFLDQIFLELRLLREKTILNLGGLFNKSGPVFVKDS